MKSLLIALLLALPVWTQNKLPDYGDLSDLKGLSKVYVSTEDAQARKYVLDKLRGDKTLTVVASSDSAEFVLECVQIGKLGHQTMGSVSVDMPTFQMTAYVLRDGHQRIAWQEAKNSVRYPPMLLTGDFLDALKKAKKSSSDD